MTLDNELRIVDKDKIQASARQALRSRDSISSTLLRSKKISEKYPALEVMRDELLTGVEGWTDDNKLAAEMAIGYVLLTLGDYATNEAAQRSE